MKLRLINKELKQKVATELQRQFLDLKFEELSTKIGYSEKQLELGMRLSSNISDTFWWKLCEEFGIDIPTKDLDVLEGITYLEVDDKKYSRDKRRYFRNLAPYCRQRFYIYKDLSEVTGIPVVDVRNIFAGNKRATDEQADAIYNALEMPEDKRVYFKNKMEYYDLYLNN